MGIKKQVIQIKDGKKIAIYDSASKAGDAIGVTKDKISKCCLGKLKLINGYEFRYSGEITNKHEDKGDFHCPYCDRHFETYNGLCKHVFSKEKPHGDITKENLLTDCFYGGKRPTCKCGCGEFTGISYEGGIHFVDYKQGHQSKIHNNWGHNEKAKEKSIETRRKQYESGIRIQWNKKKKWEETYSEEKIKELREYYKNEERNDKISKALKGVPKSDEHAEKCRENGRSEKSIMANRKKMEKILSSGEFSISSMIELKFISECIEPLGIEFITQYYIKDLHHYCDVYIPSKNTVIEFQGDYWHGNPKKYLKEELSVYQLKRIEKDEVLRKYCKENSINLVEVWESDYNREPENIKNTIKEILL